MRNDPDIIRTPNADCLACKLFQQHSKDEMSKYHPDAGHGVDNRNKSIKKLEEANELTASSK